eukprot:2437744-Rhodomonas_salina.4
MLHIIYIQTSVLFGYELLHDSPHGLEGVGATTSDQEAFKLCVHRGDYRVHSLGVLGPLKGLDTQSNS